MDNYLMNTLKDNVIKEIYCEFGAAAGAFIEESIDFIFNYVLNGVYAGEIELDFSGRDVDGFYKTMMQYTHFLLFVTPNKLSEEIGEHIHFVDELYKVNLQ